MDEAMDDREGELNAAREGMYVYPPVVGSAHSLSGGWGRTSVQATRISSKTGSFSRTNCAKAAGAEERDDTSIGEAESKMRRGVLRRDGRTHSRFACRVLQTGQSLAPIQEKRVKLSSRSSRSHADGQLVV